LKQENNNNYMRKFLQVAENQKKRLFMLLITYALLFTELKYYQRRSERPFELILVLQGGFMCVILECFVNFQDDPYYEPLLWFMMIGAQMYAYIKPYKSMHVVFTNAMVVIINADKCSSVRLITR